MIQAGHSHNTVAGLLNLWRFKKRCQDILLLSYDKNLYKILITRGGDRRHEQTSDSGNTRSAAA